MFQLGEDMISFCCDFRAEAVYQSMKSTFGGQNCHLLHINSRSLHTAESMHTDLPDPWSQFLNKNNSEANSVSTGQSKNGQSVLSVYDFISMIECNKKSVKAILGTILILEFLMWNCNICPRWPEFFFFLIKFYNMFQSYIKKKKVKVTCRIIILAHFLQQIKIP